MDGIDTDLPTYYEAIILQNVFGKAFFCTFQIFFYAVRPMLVKAQPLTLTHLFNALAQITFDVVLVALRRMALSSLPLILIATRRILTSLCCAFYCRTLFIDRQEETRFGRYSYRDVLLLRTSQCTLLQCRLS